eukprot:566991-Prymnesium_polylepis.1
MRFGAGGGSPRPPAPSRPRTPPTMCRRAHAAATATRAARTRRNAPSSGIAGSPLPERSAVARSTERPCGAARASAPCEMARERRWRRRGGGALRSGDRCGGRDG